MNCNIELNQETWKNNMKMQVATHCAQVLAGVKPSNAVTLDRKDTRALIQNLYGTEIQCRLIYAGEKKCIWLLYREQELKQYLMKKKHQDFMKSCGYQSFQLKNIFSGLGKNYREYKNGNKEFPHELGLILGYPLCDVEGFIKYQGSNYLYSGYWKVYGNARQTKQLFSVYDLVRYQIIKQVEYGKPLLEIVASYEHYRVPQLA